jgi:phage/plasmid-like protein (TIGR03299 family)
MSHEISATDQVFTAGATAWHGLDTNFKQRLTADEARQFLDWKVKKVPIAHEGKPVPGAFFTVREDAEAVLGIVGSQYKVIQNDWLFKFLEPVIDPSEGRVYETGGSLKGGRRVWVLMSLPGEYYVTQDDKVKPYLMVANSHDGSLTFTIMHTEVRVVCNNTLSAALSAARVYIPEEDDTPDDLPDPVIRIKHMPGYKQQIAVAHKAMGLATANSRRLSTIFQLLAEKAMTGQEVTQFVKFLIPSKREDEGRGPDARIEDLRNRILLGFDAEINNLDPNARHTAWAAYNAATDWIDHGQPTRKGGDRTNWSWFGRGRSLRARALSWLVRTKLKDQNRPDLAD